MLTLRVNTRTKNQEWWEEQQQQQKTLIIAKGI